MRGMVLKSFWAVFNGARLLCRSEASCVSAPLVARCPLARRKRQASQRLLAAGDGLGPALPQHPNDEPRLLDTIVFLRRSFLPFPNTPFYLGNDIMADALCGPSNPLQTFQKQTSVDRTLQQDRFATRQQQQEVCRCDCH